MTQINTISLPLTPQLMAGEIQRAKPPRTLHERFVYFTAIDPALSPLTVTVYKVALITLAAFLSLATLGLAGVLIYELMKVNESYQTLSMRITSDYDLLEKTANAALQEFEKSQKYDTFTHLKKMLCEEAQKGHIDRASYVAQRLPEIKPPKGCYDQLVLHFSYDLMYDHLQSQTLFQIAQVATKKQDLSHGLNILEGISSEDLRYQQQALLSFANNDSSQAFAYASKISNGDMRRSQLSEFHLQQNAFPEALAQIALMENSGHKIVALCLAIALIPHAKENASVRELAKIELGGAYKNYKMSHSDIPETIQKLIQRYLGS